MVEERLGYRIKRAQHALRAAVDSVLRDEGLTMSQYAALAAIGVAGVSSNAELAARAFVTPQSAHEILRGLEASGLVERRAGGGRGRASAITLTAAGHGTLARADVAVAAVEARIAARLGQADADRLSSLLRDAADALGG